VVCFEKISHIKINDYKSDLTLVNLEEENIQTYAKIFCCKIGTFPFKYLGVPLQYDMLRTEDIQPVVNKIINRIPGWIAKLLSYGARITLLKAYVASILIYLMYVIKFPKWFIEASTPKWQTSSGMIKRITTNITYLIGNLELEE
jgi:hypothetical protein